MLSSTLALTAFPSLTGARGVYLSGMSPAPSFEDEPPAANLGPPWAEKLVRFLDDGLVVPGTQYRFGFDGILGLLLPGAGDAVTAAGALSLLYLALQRGVPRVVLTRMALNVAIDAIVGAIPIVGDLFDFAYKANRRNLRLLERATQQPTRRKTAADYAIVAVFVMIVASMVVLPLVLMGLLFRYLAGPE